MHRAVRVVFFVGLLGLSACGDARKDNDPLVPAPGSRPVEPADFIDAASDKNVKVIIDTSMGQIKAELFTEKAPITVKNFLQYVDEKHYDGTIFHRVISNFMIQGGGMVPGGDEKKTHPPIKNEGGNGLPNKRGTLAMARTSVPDSATSQFFINVKYNDFLDRANANDRVGYAVFGRVTEGMAVVEAIKNVRTGPNDVPVRDVIIKSIRRVEKDS